MSDFDRPLNTRGEKAAMFMGTMMAARGLVPEIIISSPAVRARETAELVASAAGFAAEIKFDERIYEASPSELLAVTSDIPDQFSTALIVGHNPGSEGFIWHLTGTLEPMPTGAVAILALRIDQWTEISEDRGTVTDVLRPKVLLSSNP